MAVGIVSGMNLFFCCAVVVDIGMGDAVAFVAPAALEEVDADTHGFESQGVVVAKLGVAQSNRQRCEVFQVTVTFDGVQAFRCTGVGDALCDGVFVPLFTGLLVLAIDGGAWILTSVLWFYRQVSGAVEVDFVLGNINDTKVFS